MIAVLLAIALVGGIAYLVRSRTGSGRNPGASSER
jgi:hypothetical protein